MAHRILLVEDDLENCDILKHYLLKAGPYEVVVAHDAGQALAAVEKQQFEVVLLDIMLPGMNGIDLCRQLRKSLYCYIIFISSLDDEETIVRALRMGGDDYITKPFRYPILQAHIEVALRRMSLGSARAAGDVAIGDMLLSTKCHVLLREGERIYLSPTEFELLLYFTNNEDVVLGFEEIYQYVWKKPSYGDLRTLFSHVRNLRKKLEADPGLPRHIVTVPRVGYRFTAKG